MLSSKLIFYFLIWNCDLLIKVSSPRDMANSRMWLETNLPKMAKLRTSNATLSMVFMIKVYFVNLNPELL